MAPSVAVSAGLARPTTVVRVSSSTSRPSISARPAQQHRAHPLAVARPYLRRRDVCTIGASSTEPAVDEDVVVAPVIDRISYSKQVCRLPCSPRILYGFTVIP